MTTQRLFIGIDPGKSGAAVAITEASDFYSSVRFNKPDRHVVEWFFDMSEHYVQHVLLEQVHAMPVQGVVSMFNFGQSFGKCQMAIAAACLHNCTTEMRAREWQKKMDCSTGGDKNVTKSKAQGLFPDLKVTHYTADALLLAVLAKRLWEAQQ